MKRLRQSRRGRRLGSAHTTIRKSAPLTPAGLVLLIYLAFYAGFMGLATFAPQAMGRPAAFGVNLAITYGMGLILGAFVVAAIYMVICGRNARAFSNGSLSDASQKRSPPHAEDRR
jgi:uncharacterized membrane protein (DUF485 family)